MLERYIIEQVLKYLLTIKNKDVYALLILVTCNEGCSYKDIDSFMSVSINYNCNNYDKSITEEEKWNIAFWDDSNEYIIIDAEDNKEGAEILYKWYKDNNINDVGYEDEDQMYDENMNYIGTGPNGYKELCLLISKIIYNIKKSSVICDWLKNIPVLILNYDYSYYITDFITIANPYNEADAFLNYYRRNISD